jgi:hypothetical protein
MIHGSSVQVSLSISSYPDQNQLIVNPTIYYYNPLLTTPTTTTHVSVSPLSFVFSSTDTIRSSIRNLKLFIDSNAPVVGTHELRHVVSSDNNSSVG